MAAQSASVKRPRQAYAAVPEQAREGRQARLDACDRGGQLAGLRWLCADAAPQAPAVRRRVDLAGGRAQRQRSRIQQPVDRSALARDHRQEVAAALARRQIAEDGVRLRQHDVAVEQHRNAAERIDRVVPIGPRLLERHREPLVLEPEHAQQEAHFLRVARARVIVESHPRSRTVTAPAPPWRARRAPRTSSARVPRGRRAPCDRRPPRRASARASSGCRRGRACERPR